MKSESLDIAIVGGGMVGVSLALLLARTLPQLRIALMEAFPFKRENLYTPSFDDRSTALSQSSRQLLEQLGVWQELSENCCPITQIHVSDKGHIGATRLSAEEQGLPALGYVVENRWLGRVLLEQLLASPVDVRAPAKVASVSPTSEGMRVAIEGGQLPLLAKLLVVADGAQSETRGKLGIGCSEESYGQMGLIANIELDGDHRNVAYERFTDQGPMALLPLQPSAGKPRAALVWTLPEPQAAELLACGQSRFLETLQRRFGYRAGEFRGVGERSVYPLRLVVADEQIRRNLVVVGNAAHSLHPVAGQGFNLALRDCGMLTSVLLEGAEAGLCCGDLSVLQRYVDAQRPDQRRTVLMSDLLPKTFGVTTPALALARNLSLLAMDASPLMRSGFANLGMGLLGKSPQLQGSDHQAKGTESTR